MNDTFNSKEKRRPPEERIAALMGKSAYLDLREGLGGTNSLKLTDQDIAAGLGMVANSHGKVSMMVLETFYGSTLLHQYSLQRTWEDRERKPGDTRERIVLTRFGGALAIRRFAGATFGTSQYAEYAYLIYSRRELLNNRVNDAVGWLESERDVALRALRKVLRDAEVTA